MTRIAYVNGAYVPSRRAQVSINDRGFQFADSVYEVVGLRDGVMLDRDGHIARLYRSLGAIGIAAPMNSAALLAVMRETVRRNQVRTGYIYIQVTRGAARRDHVFPGPSVKPFLLVSVTPLSRAGLVQRGCDGVRVVTVPDLRWARCDIKTTGLLPNVLAKQAASEAGAQEAWLLDASGQVTEGAASNAWIVDHAGRLRTPPLSTRILAGVTRETILNLAREMHIPVAEESFSPAEAIAAREAFLTSASNGPVPIVAIDGEPVAGGRPGEITRALRDAYFGAHGLIA